MELLTTEGIKEHVLKQWLRMEKQLFDDVVDKIMEKVEEETGVRPDRKTVESEVWLPFRLVLFTSSELEEWEGDVRSLVNKLRTECEEK